jgi:predicted DNA-binding transcriptional regulator AlpA
LFPVQVPVIFPSSVLLPQLFSLQAYRPMAFLCVDMTMSEQIPEPTSSLLQHDYLEWIELARELGKSTRTRDRWHSLRIGPPCVVIGRTFLYRRQSVLEWLASREEPAAA